MTTAALLTVDGPVHPVAAVLAAAAGAVAGGAVGHRLGTRTGRAFLQRLSDRERGPVTRSRIASLENVTERLGLWVVAAAPFSAVLRNTIAPVCGTLGTKRFPFLTVTAVGVAVWAGANVAAVQLLGNAAGQWISVLTAVGLAALFAVLLSAGVRNVIRLWRRHRRADPLQSP
ncbi:DedA family protein [Streptomyces sp. NPDC002499]